MPESRNHSGPRWPRLLLAAALVVVPLVATTVVLSAQGFGRVATLAAKPLGKGASFAAVYSATLGGARSLFIEDKTGSIEKGKEADLIYIKPEYGSRDPYFDVLSSRHEDLKLVMVAGNPILSKP